MGWLDVGFWSGAPHSFLQAATRRQLLCAMGLPCGGTSGVRSLLNAFSGAPRAGKSRAQPGPAAAQPPAGRQGRPPPARHAARHQRNACLRACAKDVPWSRHPSLHFKLPLRRRLGSGAARRDPEPPQEAFPCAHHWGGDVVLLRAAGHVVGVQQLVGLGQGSGDGRAASWAGRQAGLGDVLAKGGDGEVCSFNFGRAPVAPHPALSPGPCTARSWPPPRPSHLVRVGLLQEVVVQLLHHRILVRAAQHLALIHAAGGAPGGIK